MTTGRTTADRVLLGVTLALLAPCLAVAAANLVSAAGPAPRPAWWCINAVQWAGFAAAWAAVAWRCSGPGPRGLALAAAAGYALTAPLVLWEWLGRPPVVPSDSWAAVACHAVFGAGWVPAAPLLAFGRRWGDGPAARNDPHREDGP